MWGRQIRPVLEGTACLREGLLKASSHLESPLKRGSVPREGMGGRPLLSWPATGLPLGLAGGLSPRLLAHRKESPGEVM